jgi:ATP-binding cassette subfamily B protein
MNTERIGLVKTLQLAGRACAVSVKTMGIASLLVNIAGFAIAFLPMLIATTLADFTDHVQMLSQGKSTVTKTFAVLMALVMLYLIQTSYHAAQTYFSEINAQRTVKYIKKTLIDCTSRVQYKYIENEGDFRNRILFAEQAGGVHVAQSMQQILLIMQSLITVISLTVKLCDVSPWIVLILFVTCIPAVILSVLQKDEEYKHKTKNMKEGAMSVHLYYICSGANERCRSLTDMRFGQIFAWVKRKWRTVSDGYLQKKNEMTRRHVFYNSLADILRNAVYIGVLLLAAWRIYQNPAIGLGVFMLVFTMSGALQTAMTKMFVGAARFFGDIKYIKDFFELSDTPQEKLEEKPRELEQADIVFEKVSFTYPNTMSETLCNLSVRINQGEKLAIVGENGSGKSTFVNLLCGLYEPSKGKVTVGGVNLSENLRAVRRAITVVFQSFGRYETTIRDNITIAAGAQELSNEKLKSLAVSTGAAEFIEKQPSGFDEEVGTFSETGNNLSGGQWQKIAMTRALCREEARVMILDEPTAALDPMAEASLYRDFAKLTGDKTTILISHRLGITSVVDRILVFDGGRIVEDGSHVELMAKNGQYAKMYLAQAQWYE